VILWRRCSSRFGENKGVCLLFSRFSRIVLVDEGHLSQVTIAGELSVAHWTSDAGPPLSYFIL
jgi:hypothetical protein